jgi:diaminohydroxyphosphoribosylaminopyrimidine deaminase/5-amino-6-(5-phosphoribosylamino)uracil reductase
MLKGMPPPHDSHITPLDNQHLARALELASEASAFASPNPTVGCVLTSPTGKILGEGAHFYDRRDHAEIAALKTAAAQGHSARGATAYVTLEPCTVHGRTGPCAEALIAAEIARCVIATADPNPEVHGNGISRLRAAGVDISLLDPALPLALEARQLNDAFALAITYSRPFVTLKAALSVDGKLAPSPTARATSTPRWLSGEAARADVQQLRHSHDVILTGIGTVIADNPSLTDRTGLSRRRPLLRTVLDTHLRVPLDSNLVQSAAGDLLILCGPNASFQSEAALVRSGVEVQRLPNPGDLQQVLSALRSRQIISILLEAGTLLNGAFLAANLVDRVIFYYAESELGSDALPFAANGVSPFALQGQLSSLSRVTFPHGASEDVRLSGYLHDPWTGLESLTPNL